MLKFLIVQRQWLASEYCRPIFLLEEAKATASTILPPASVPHIIHICVV
jgi:hypothetical protein